MQCYSCGENVNLKQYFSILIEKVGPRDRALMIRGSFGIDENQLILGTGLCKDCMALAFEDCAKELRSISDEDFKFIV